MTYNEAYKILKSKGLRQISASPFDDREYWGFEDSNVFLDHSATITMIGNKFLISDFIEMGCEKKYPMSAELLARANEYVAELEA